MRKNFKQKLLFSEFEVKKTAFFNRLRVGSLLNNIPNSYNNNGLFLCLKKHISLYSFKMNDMSKLNKHVRIVPRNFFFKCLFMYCLVSVSLWLSHIHYVKVPYYSLQQFFVIHPLVIFKSTCLILAAGLIVYL